MALETPRWIEKSFRSVTGRDHLGLGSAFSTEILPSLVDGINALTYHPRYVSFYAFLLDEFWSRERPRTRQSWKAFFRPRAFIFSLGAHLPGHEEDCPEHKGTGHIVGSSHSSGRARRQEASYRTTEDYIKSSFGGYGLYYRSVMVELGVIYPPNEQTNIEVPTPDTGKRLAQAFRDAVEETAYYQQFFQYDETDVPTDVIQEFANAACHCQLRGDAPDRWPLLNIYLHGGQSSLAQARRETFQLLLELAAKTGSLPLTERAFREFNYFHEHRSGTKFLPSEMTRVALARWRLYQAREFYVYALNELWRQVCEWGYANHGDDRPLPVQSWWTFVLEQLDIGVVGERIGISAPPLNGESPFRDLLAWLRFNTGESPTSLDAPFDMQASLHEFRLYDATIDTPWDPVVGIGGMITLLGLIYLRFSEPSLANHSAWPVAYAGSGGRLPIATSAQSFESSFLSEMRRRVRRGDTIAQVARWLVTDYVMLQHQLVASSKLPEDTYRFQREGDRLRFFLKDNSVGFGTSRFEAITTTLFDLGLVTRFGDPDHHLTPDGKTLLARGDIL